MNDSSSSLAFINDPVASGFAIREQNCLANNSEEEQATSITPSATSNSGDEGSDKVMESINNNDITANGNDLSNSHHQHMTETVEFNEASFGSMKNTSGNAAHLSGNHRHSSSNNMSAGEADERQAIADMEIPDSSNHLSSSNNMSAGEADERQAFVDLEIQDSSSSGEEELEIVDKDVDDVSDKFGSNGLALGGLPVQEQQQQQHNFNTNEATHNVPVNAMNPFQVDVARESATQQQVEPTAAQAPAAAAASSADAEVIELLDDDDADDNADSDNTDDLITKALTSNMNQAKRQKVSENDNGNQTAPPSYQSPYETAQQQPYQPPPPSKHGFYHPFP